MLQGDAKGPGIFFILPCIDTYIKVDLRVISFDVPPQEILTRDSVTVAVDAVVYFRISNPIWSVVNVEDAHRSTKLLAQTTLRNELGTKNLSEVRYCNYNYFFVCIVGIHLPPGMKKFTTPKFSEMRQPPPL